MILNTLLVSSPVPVHLAPDSVANKSVRWKVPDELMPEQVVRERALRVVLKVHMSSMSIF